MCALSASDIYHYTLDKAQEAKVRHVEVLDELDGEVGCTCLGNALHRKVQVDESSHHRAPRSASSSANNAHHVRKRVRDPARLRSLCAGDPPRRANRRRRSCVRPCADLPPAWQRRRQRDRSVQEWIRPHRHSLEDAATQGQLPHPGVEHRWRATVLGGHRWDCEGCGCDDRASEREDCRAS